MEYIYIYMNNYTYIYVCVYELSHKCHSEASPNVSRCQVGLVGDALGPVPLTDDFLVDFAAVDQGWDEL